MVMHDHPQEQEKEVQRSRDENRTKVSPADQESHRTKLNAGTSDPTDGRMPYEWISCYEPEAKKEIRLELAYLIFVLFCSYALIFGIWMECFKTILPFTPGQILTLKKYSYYALSGLLGGVSFGIKYLYRCVARGYWHQDRRIWRIMSPIIAMTVAFIVGTMIDASFMTTNVEISGAACISIGFLSGYFADQAVGKMYEVAQVLFGKSATSKS